MEWFCLQVPAVFVLLLSCVHASPQDSHRYNLGQLDHHVSDIAAFQCSYPQPRMLRMHQLLPQHETHGKAYFPDVTVLHHCDDGCGSCPSGQTCGPLHADYVQLPFQVTFLQDLGHHKTGTWHWEYRDVANHTVCSCYPLSSHTTPHHKTEVEDYSSHSRGHAMGGEDEHSAGLSITTDTPQQRVEMDCARQCTVSVPGPSMATCGGSSVIMFMALLEQFLRTQCDVEDPCRHFPSRPVPDAEYDFIVAGGGSAGAVVASRLSEVPEWRVLLIEAGTNEPTGSQIPSFIANFIGSSIDWKYHTEPEDMACLGSKEHRCYWPRGKVIGGTSVLNGMMYMRGSRKDYDDWENEGNTGWSYKNVLPFFLKSENNLQIENVDKRYHSEGGYLPVTKFPYQPPMAQDILEGAKELGQSVRDPNGEIHEGFDVMQTTSRNGIRYSTSRAFLRPAGNRPNLHIMLNTTVARVLVDPTKKQAYGVEIITPSGKIEKVLAKKEVVISGGAVNSPQLLLLSGIGDRNELAKVDIPVAHHLPGVGRNLHNHVAFRLSFYVNSTAVKDLNWATAMQFMLFRDGPMASTGLSQVTGLIKSKFANASEDHPDIQLFFGGYSGSCANTGEVGEISGKAVNGVPPKRTITIIPTCLHPKSRGYLVLKDKNPLSHPKIYARYLTEPIDVATVIEGIKFALRLSKSKALEKYGLELDKTPAKGCEDKKFGLQEYWECALRMNTVPEHHQAGSCKMGPASDPQAVVDPQLRVHGVQGIRVMDTSIMPAVTSGNTNVPVIMIAEKGTDMIKKAWLSQ